MSDKPNPEGLITVSLRIMIVAKGMPVLETLAEVQAYIPDVADFDELASFMDQAAHALHCDAVPRPTQYTVAIQYEELVLSRLAAFDFDTYDAFVAQLAGTIPGDGTIN